MRKKDAFPHFSAVRVTLWLALVCLCAGLLAVPGAEAASQYEYTLQDWMKRLPDTMQISQINIPGTHDTGTTYIWSYTGRSQAQCQDLSIPQQLQHGLRWLDIRLGEWDGYEWGYTVPVEYSMRLCHQLYDGFTDDSHNYRLNFIQVLNYIGTFLEEHPSETVIIRLQGERQNEVVEPMIENIMTQHHYKQKERPGNFPWLVSYRVDDPVPTLGEVRGKCVVLSYSQWNGQKYARNETWTNYDVSGDLWTTDVENYADPPLKRKYIEQLLKKSENYPQNYYSETNDKFQKTRASLQSDTNNAFPNGPMRISTAMSAQPLYGPRTCFEYLYYRSNDDSPTWRLLTKYYAGLRDVSLYTQNTRTGWWNFDFPQDQQIRQIITSNYLDVEAYSILVDVRSLPTGIKIKDALQYLNPVVKLDNGVQLKPISEWYVSPDDPNFYRRDYEKHPDAQTVTDVNADFSYQQQTYFAVCTSRYIQSDGPGIRHVYETYIFNDGSKPLEADVTVYWDTDTFKDQRPQNPGALLKMLNGEALPFTFVNRAGQSGVFQARVEHINSTSYAYNGSERSDYAHFKVNLPIQDKTGQRAIYNGLEFPLTEESGYVVNSISKDPTLDLYTVHIRYKLDLGFTEVKGEIEWLDGNDYYGMREQAQAYIRNESDFYSPRQCLKSATVADDAESVRYVLDESKYNKANEMHEISVPKLNGTPTVQDYHYATAGGVTQYEANLDPAEQRNLFAFNKAYLMGTYDVQITWVGDDPSERPSDVTIYVAGNPTSNIPTVYPPSWRAEGFPIQVFDDKNKEIDYEKSIGLSFTTSKGDIEDYGYIPSWSVKKIEGEYGKLPKYQINIIMRKDQNVDLKGKVIWRDGDLTSEYGGHPIHPNEFEGIAKRYMKDPDGGDEPENLITELINVYDAKIRWNDNRSEFSFDDLSYFPAFSDTGTPCTYWIASYDVEDYLEEVDGMTIVLTRAVTVSGTVDWENGMRASNDQPIVQLWRTLQGEDTPVPYGDPVTCEDYRYSFKELPVCDENDVPYVYSITASLPEKIPESSYMITCDSVRNPNSGNVTANGVIRTVTDPLIARVPVTVSFNDAAAAESETFAFVMEGGTHYGLYRETIELNSENGFKGTFSVDVSGLQTDHPYPFKARQLPGNTAGWEYDGHEETVYVTIRYIDGTQPVLQVDMGGRLAVPFNNTYKPVSGTLRIPLEKQINNLLKGYETAPEETFTFALFGNGDFTAEEPLTVSRKGEGKAYFPPVTFDKSGTYTLHVMEISEPVEEGWEYDNESYPVSVTVTDMGGFLKATVDSVPVITNLFENVFYDISVRVQWQGKNDKTPIPQSVNVKLSADGGNAGEANVDAKTGWSCEFPDMPGFSKLLMGAKAPVIPVKPINYTVSADEVPGYTKTITGSAKTGFVIVYTIIPPKTGDDAPLGLWFLLLGGAVLTMTCMTHIARRKRG